MRVFNPNISIFFFFFFFDMSIQKGEKIQTSDLHFIKRGSSQLSYLLRTSPYSF
jgi:hypothetical protein